jgi:hypothetical protein
MTPTPAAAGKFQLIKVLDPELKALGIEGSTKPSIFLFTVNSESTSDPTQAYEQLDRVRKSGNMAAALDLSQRLFAPLQIEGPAGAQAAKVPAGMTLRTKRLSKP